MTGGPGGCARRQRQLRVRRVLMWSARAWLPRVACNARLRALQQRLPSVLCLRTCTRVQPATRIVFLFACELASVTFDACCTWRPTAAFCASRVCKQVPAQLHCLSPPDLLPCEILLHSSVSTFNQLRR